MCRMASFLYRATRTGVEVAVYDLTSHSKTQEHYPGKTEAKGWYEGHYTPDGELQCRTPTGRDAVSESLMRDKWPTFRVFYDAHVTGAVCSEACDARGCDLKGVTLPESIGDWLDVSGCDLKGVTLPESIGGGLYVSGCDLKGVTWPESIGGVLDVSGCDLNGVTLPEGVTIYK